MKKLLGLVGMILITLSVSAQFPGGGAGNGKAGQAAPNIGHIYGKVVDSLGKPISDVSIVLLQNRFDSTSKKRKDFLLKGITTKAKGEFDFSDLPMFGVKMKISATGYKPYEQPISFQMKMDPSASKIPSGDASQGMAAMSGLLNAFDKDLGNIKLTTDVQQLKEVTVTSTKAALQLDIDKKVFNVDKNIVSAGGTAVDVMKNVPSVQVDIDGNVKLRNATPQIYIEGRPTTLSLDQIPADAIESVEVITNPSAKYDASGGGAGILNIILKKNKKTGYNGNLRAGVDKRGGINGGADFNVREGKVNFSASANVNQMRGVTTGTTERLNFVDTPQTQINQTNYNKMKGGFAFGRVGLDYFLTNRTTLSIAGIKVHGEFHPNELISINTDSLYNTGTTSSLSQRNSTGTREFNAHGIQAGMKHLFPKEGEELTADLNFFSGKNKNSSLYTTDYYGNSYANKIGTQLQQVLGAGTNQFFTVQTDYVNPITKKLKLEAGLRAQMRKLSNDNNNYYFDENSGQFVVIPSATSNYKNTDNVYAAYGTITQSFKTFGYKIGLRAESSNYSGELTNTSQKFGSKYPVSLFPSVFLSEKLNANQELQLSYTRRINRPNFFQLLPFTDYSDNLNIQKGNPDLVPEFTNSLDFSYMKTFKKNNNILVSAYYKKSNNLITRYQDKQYNPISGKDDLINTFINANSSYSFGTEVTSTNYIKKWWDLTTNLNLYNSKINTDNITGQSQDAIWSWFGKFNSNFKLPSNYSIQLSATYQSKTNLPINSGGGGFGGGFGQSQSSSQGYIKPSYGVDMAFKKSFLKNNAASVTFSVNDIFKTRKSEQYSESQYFVQTYSRIRDPQMFRINLAYRFGKMDMSLFKRKSMNNSGAAGATDGMQQ